MLAVYRSQGKALRRCSYERCRKDLTTNKSAFPPPTILWYGPFGDAFQVNINNRALQCLPCRLLSLLYTHALLTITMERLEKFSDPNVIPLPPSPPARIRVPSRRPPGWVSTLPDIDLDALDNDNAPNPTAITNGSSVTQRREDAHPPSRVRQAVAALGHGHPSATTSARTRGPSRRVSSTMSYALIASRSASRSLSDARIASLTGSAAGSDRRASTPGPLTPALTEARSISDVSGASRPQTPHPQQPSYGKDEATIRIASDREIDEYEQALETPLAPPRSPTPAELESPLERPEWLDEVLEERRADEEWMSYVRAQLGALFPDFVDTPSDQPAVENQETSAAAWDNGGEAGRSLVNNVPSVRSEIDELRDEIERLRGVVGGLASDLSGGVPVPVTSNEIATSSTPPVDAGDEDDRAAVEGLLGNEEARKQDTPAESELGLPRQVSSNELRKEIKLTISTSTF